MRCLPRIRLPVAIAVICAVAAMLACGERITEPERLFEAGHARIEAGEDTEGVALLRRIVEEFPDSRQAALLRDTWSVYEELLEIEAERGPVQATRDLRLLGAALEQHHRRGRGYPEDLVSLVPGDLEQLPADPWDRPYAYRRTGRGYVLETLGADGEKGGDGADRDIRVIDGIIRNGAAAGLRDPA